MLMQDMHEGGPQKQRWWILAKAKQGFRQLQKLNLAFQDWTERFWKASAVLAFSLCKTVSRLPHPMPACTIEL